MLEKIEMASVMKCLPKSRREHTYTQNDFLSSNCQRKRAIEMKLKSKAVYKSLVQKIKVTPAYEKISNPI